MLSSNRFLLASLTLALASSCSESVKVRQNKAPEGGQAPSTSALRSVQSSFEDGELTRACDAAIATAKAKLDAVAATPADQRSEQLLESFETAMADFSDKSSPLTFMHNVSTDEKTRDESTACEEKTRTFSNEVYGRKDLYNALKDVKTRNDDQKRLLSETLKAFEKNGTQLPDDKLAEALKLRKQISELETKFSRNIAESKLTLSLTAEELDGVPADVVSRFKKGSDGKYIVPTDKPTYFTVEETAKNADTRRRMMEVFNNIAADKNVALLEQAVQLREQLAGVMGFETWADYQIQNRMAKGKKEVLDFLHDLQDRMRPRRDADLAKFLAYMKTENPSQDKLNDWDWRYAADQIRKRDYGIDEERIREYFPSKTVVAGMFKVYSQLLGVTFEEVPNADVWEKTVKQYRVKDRDGTTLAFFYTDFIPREGKYNHAAAFPLLTGRRTAQGYNQPVAAIVANFRRPAAGKPSLMSHDEVLTLFHEFGHIMHFTLTKAPYASLAGFNVAQDFVEAPSQMLENWVWNKDILAALSGHYQRPSEKLPEEIIQKLIGSRDVDLGVFYSRQLMFGLYDMELHTATGPVDSTALGAKLTRDVMGVEPSANSHFQAGFGHIMDGYDAGYYGYLWSEVYAQDMFSKFEKDGRLLDAQLGADYRKDVLEPGDMEDAMDLLRHFLGREPNKDAFLRKLGIGS